MTDDPTHHDPTHDDPGPDEPVHIAHGAQGLTPAATGDDLDDTIGALLDDLDDLDDPDDPDEPDDDLDLDVDDEADGFDEPGSHDDRDGSGHHASGIELDVDDDDRDGDGDLPPAGPEDDAIALDLVDDDATAGYDAQTLDHLAALGGVDADALHAALAELGLDEAADARSAVIALEHLGVDALVAFGDVDGLVDLLERGATVQMGDARLVGIDDLTDEAVVETADGRTGRVPLDELERRWAAHGYELVVGGGSAVLPISLDLRDGGVPG